MVSSEVLFGMFLAFLASSMNATGLNLQRLGQKREKGGKDKKSKIEARKLNRLGIFLSTSCGLVDLLSFRYAPQTVLAPFGAVTLIINLLLAPIVQGEKLGVVDFVSTGFVVLGVALCLTFGPGEARKFETVDELLDLTLRGKSIGYLAFLGLFLAFLSYFILSKESADSENKVDIRVAASYPIIAGTNASLTALIAKMLTYLVELQAKRSSIILCLLLMLATAIVTPTVNNLGLGKYPPLLLVPIFSATFVTTGMMGGGIIFNEFATFTYVQWLAYFLGTTFIVGGVLLLASKASNSKSAERLLRRLIGTML